VGYAVRPPPEADGRRQSGWPEGKPVAGRPEGETNTATTPVDAGVAMSPDRGSIPLASIIHYREADGRQANPSMSLDPAAGRVFCANPVVDEWMNRALRARSEQGRSIIGRRPS